MCDCKVGPGKFEGESALAFLAYQAMLDGCADTSTGTDGSPVDWFRYPLNFDAVTGAAEAAEAYGYCADCIASAEDDIKGGVSLWESEQGFVYLTTYETCEQFDKALADAERDDERAEASALAD